MPPNRSLQWPVLAMRGETTYVVGNTFPRTNDANELSTKWAIVILRIPGAPIVGPPGDFVFKHPRAAIDSAGRLHLVWGEPADRARAAREWIGHPPTALWYASYGDGRWSAPERLFEASTIHWDDAAGGLRVDEAGRLHVVAAAWLATGQPALVYVRRSGGGWERHEMRGLSTYSTMAAWGRDSLGIAHAGPDPSVRSGDALFLTISGDAGRTWSAPRVVARGSQNSISDVALHAAASDLHLVWLQGPYGRGASQALRYLRGVDRGRDWIAQPEAPLPAGRHQMRFQVAISPCGAGIALAESIGGSADSLTVAVEEVRWTRGSVATRPLFPQFLSIGSPGVVADQRTFRVVFQAVVADSPTPANRTLTAVSSACG